MLLFEFATISQLRLALEFNTTQLNEDNGDSLFSI